MPKEQLSVVYISPHFPFHRNGFELVELEELASLVKLYLVSLRRPTQEGWEWMTNRISCQPGRNYAVLGRTTVIRALPWIGASVFANRASSRMLRKAFQMDLRGGLKTAVALMAGRYAGRIAREFKADLIHADFASAPATVAMAAAEQAGVPFTFCGHAFDIFSSKPGGKATELLIREKAKVARALFAENSKVVSELQTMTGGTDKIHLKRNGFRGDIRPPKSRVGSRPFKIVGLGALVEKKGFDLLVRAVAGLTGKGEQVEVTIHGEGSERGHLTRLAEELRVPLKLPGAYRHSEVEGILDRADVMVLPSRMLRDKDSDGVPTVFLEALRCGVPIIGANAGSVRDIIRDGETGWLVKPENVEDLTRAISECMHDYARACQLCVRGQELLVAEFSASDSARLMVQVWNNILSPR
jgi:glycosyltransferase involved in cell wall biosynthesis